MLRSKPALRSPSWPELPSSRVAVHLSPHPSTPSPRAPRTTPPQISSLDQAPGECPEQSPDLHSYHDAVQ